jgi:hypothetical protein
MDNDTSLDCNEEIKALIAERMEKGRKAYGHGLMQNSGYDWVQEALEEALDLSIYLSAKLIEIKASSRSDDHREAVANFPPAVERS